MKRTSKTFFSVAVFATLFFTACEPKEPKGGGDDNNGTVPDEVVINGITWATRNVGGTGAFMTNPEDYGNYFDWQEAKNACPSGWRLPTKAEFETLITAGSIWTTQNGKAGRKFGSGNNTIFMPAAGVRDGSLSGVGGYGYYWSSTSLNSENAYCWEFSVEYALSDYGYKGLSMSVRCVK